MIMEIPKEFLNRHSSTLAVFKYFAYDHLREPMHSISKMLYNVAYSLILTLPDSPELTTGLRKLLEAKDCFVRTALELPSEPAWPDPMPAPRAREPHPITDPNAKEGGIGAI